MVYAGWWRPTNGSMWTCWMSETTIREATGSDEEAILATLRLALGETPLLQRSPELWAWKHRLNPFGESIVMIAEEGGVVAGVRALMRWDLITPSGGRLRCARPVDTATHPQFTRRGIFRNLTMTALEVARDQSIDLVFNTPNQKSAPGYLDMGWRHVSWIGAQVRPRLGSSSAQRESEPPAIERLAPSMSAGSPIPGDLPIRDPRGLRTPRIEEYLSWRFAQHPTASYGWLRSKESDGVLVARASSRAGRSELVVSDLIGKVHPDLIGRAARTARVRYLAGWFSPASPERGIAMRGGLVPVPGLKTLRLVALPLNSLDFDPFDIRSWDICTSDLELL